MTDDTIYGLDDEDEDLDGDDPDDDAFPDVRNDPYPALPDDPTGSE